MQMSDTNNSHLHTLALAQAIQTQMLSEGRFIGIVHQKRGPCPFFLLTADDRVIIGFEPEYVYVSPNGNWRKRKDRSHILHYTDQDFSVLKICEAIKQVQSRADERGDKDGWKDPAHSGR